MFVVTYAAALLAVTYAVTAAAFLFYRRDTLAVLFVCYMLSAAAWIGGNALADVSYTGEGLIGASQFAFAFGMVNVFCFLLLVDFLITEQLPSRGRILAYALPNVLVFFLAFTPHAITDIAFPLGQPAEITPGFPYMLAFWVLLSALGYATVRLGQEFSRPLAHQRRMQLSYVFAGLLATLLGQIIFDLFLPLMGETRFYTLGPLSSVFFALACGQAILKYKFIDLRLVIRMLERKVEERTRELVDLQKRQRQMIADLSHNLQTPLAVLKGKLELSFLHDQELSSIEKSVGSISHVVADMLALTTLEDALVVEERVSFELSTLVRDVAEEIELIAADHNIHIHTDIVPGVMVEGNERRLREVVLNLANNAIKYMGDGPVREVRFILLRAGSTALLMVQDTGIGISPKDVPHIFDRFYRGANRIYGNETGSGLGLASVESIVKNHGGSVVVESEVGNGSQFTVRIPLAQ